jgi:hypothetical protein
MSVEKPGKRVYITCLKYQLLAICFFPGTGLYENALKKCAQKMELYGVLSSGSGTGKDAVLWGRYTFETFLKIYQWTRRQLIQDLNLE